MMKLNLNEIVNAVFKGVILVLASAFSTILMMLVRPQRTIARVEQRLRNPHLEQIAPRVLLFLSVFALLVCIPFLTSLLASDPARRPPGETAEEVIRTLNGSMGEVLFAVTVASIVVVAVVEFVWHWIAILTRQRRRLVIHAMMLVMSVQVFVLVALIAVAQISGFLFPRPTAFIASWPTFFYFNNWGTTFLLLQATLLSQIAAVAAIVGIPLAIGYAAFVVWPTANLASKRFKFDRKLLGAGMLGASAALLPVSLALADIVQTALTPKPPAKTFIAGESCRIRSEGGAPELVIQAVVANRAATPLVVETNDLRIDMVVLTSDGAVRPANLTGDSFNRWPDAFAAEGRPLPIVLDQGESTIVEVTYRISEAVADEIRASFLNLQCQLVPTYGTADSAMMKLLG
jgi:hypothetical protein